MTKLYYDTELDSDDLAQRIAMDWDLAEIRQFIENICEYCQMLEVDEAILADRYRKVKSYYEDDGDKLKMKELCSRHPPITS